MTAAELVPQCGMFLQANRKMLGVMQLYVCKIHASISDIGDGALLVLAGLEML